MSKTNKILYFFIAVIFFIIFDIYFSEYILNNLRFSTEVNPVFELIFVQNTGAAFSLLEDSKIFLVSFSIISIILILIYVFKNAEKFSTIASFWAAMLVAGISCNLYERIYFGYVRDFFKLNFINFPVFNISDIFINISVILLIIIIIKNKYIKNKKK